MKEIKQGMRAIMISLKQLLELLIVLHSSLVSLPGLDSEASWLREGDYYSEGK